MTISDIEDKVRNEVLDTYPQDGINIVIPTPDNYAFQLSTTSNELQSNSSDNGMSIINLGKCEELLKLKYNLSENDTLIILKYEKLTGIGSEKSIQYEVYHPYTYQKLNLSICDNTSINIAIPIEIDDNIKQLYNNLEEEGYNLFDLNSKFYLDICTPFQAENGADILLVDRIYYIFSKVKNITVCPSNCHYSSFSMDIKYLSCECDIQNESIDLVNREKFIGEANYSLTDYKLEYTSYKTMKCYNLVFDSKHFKKNYGSMILIALSASFIGFMIYFIVKGLSPIKASISRILFGDNNLENKISPFFDIKPKKQAKSVKAKSTKGTKSTKSVKGTKSTKSAKSVKGFNPPRRRTLKDILKDTILNNKERLGGNKLVAMKMMKTNNNNIINNNINPINTNSLIDIKANKTQIKEEEDIKNDIKVTHNIKNDNKGEIKGNIQISAGGIKSFYMDFGSKINLKQAETKTEKTKKSKKKPKKKSNLSDDEKPKKVKFKEALESSTSMIEDPYPKEDTILDDYELNHLEYFDAVDLDKRNCCQIYCSILKRDHNIMSICFTNVYNLFYAKIAKLIVSISTLMAMNAFLFADKSFHKLFMDGVRYYWIYQVIQIVLSVVITYVFEVILCFFTLTDTNIYEIKILHKNENNGDKIFKILKFMRKKLIIFYIIAFLLLIFYWYFISAFCAVYPNSKKIYLIDCAISFAVFSLLPFIIYGFTAICRTISLKDEDKKRFKCLYSAGQFLPLV